MNKMCASLFFLVCNLVASEQSLAIFVATQEGNHEGVVFGGLDPDAAPFVPRVLGAALEQTLPEQNKSRLLAFIGSKGDQSDNQDPGLQPVFYKKTRRGKRGSSKSVYEKQKSVLPNDLLEVHDEEGRQRYFCNAIENNRPPLFLDGTWDPVKELSDRNDLPECWWLVIKKAWDLEK